MTATTTPTVLRKDELAELVRVLEDQHAQKRDMVVRADTLRSEWGRLVVPSGGEPVITDDGVTASDLRVDIGDRMLGGFADRYDTLSRRHLRALRDKAAAGIEQAASGELPDYSDWLRLVDDTLTVPLRHDDRKFLLRTFDRGDGTAFGRCVLSDKFSVGMDNIDTLTAAADAIQQADPTCTVDSCDLSESHMRVRFKSESVTAMAPTLLEGYRTPFERPGGSGHGQAGLRDGDGNLPIVHAGFELRNSETGQGQWVLTPRLVVKVCNNGMVIDQLKMARPHRGSKLEEGLIEWSDETRRLNVDLIRSSTKDAVRTFLNPEFLADQIAGIEAKAGAPVDRPEKALERVASECKYTDDERDAILSFFVKGGQSTAGGVMNAVTAFSQTVEDPDRAAEIEASGLDALAVAAR